MDLLPDPTEEVQVLGQGQVLDVAGRSQPAEGLTWLVDGTVVATDTKLASTDPLLPGRHRVELRLGEQRSSVAVVVASPSPAQQRMLDLLASESDEA